MIQTNLLSVMYGAGVTLILLPPNQDKRRKRPRELLSRFLNTFEACFKVFCLCSTMSWKLENGIAFINTSKSIIITLATLFHIICHKNCSGEFSTTPGELLDCLAFRAELLLFAAQEVLFIYPIEAQHRPESGTLKISMIRIESSEAPPLTACASPIYFACRQALPQMHTTNCALQTWSTRRYHGQILESAKLARMRDLMCIICWKISRTTWFKTG